MPLFVGGSEEDLRLTFIYNVHCRISVIEYLISFKAGVSERKRIRIVGY